MDAAGTGEVRMAGASSGMCWSGEGGRLAPQAFLPWRERAPGLVVRWLPPCLRQLGARAECLPSARFHTGVGGSVHAPLFHSGPPPQPGGNVNGLQLYLE